MGFYNINPIYTFFNLHCFPERFLFRPQRHRHRLVGHPNDDPENLIELSLRIFMDCPNTNSNRIAWVYSGNPSSNDPKFEAGLMNPCIQIMPNPHFFEISRPNNMLNTSQQNVSCCRVGYAFGGLATHLSSDICRCEGILNTAIAVPNNEPETEGWIEFNVYDIDYKCFTYARRTPWGRTGESEDFKERKDRSQWILWDSSSYEPHVHTMSPPKGGRCSLSVIIYWRTSPYPSAFGVSFSNVQKGAGLKQTILKRFSNL